ncbi:hypothetical protein [Methylobacterium ajmalii]|uniref:hypothetical protein n=1 Tax=Methylobacterium ajmalii TaxID=2738439 RepID=UPI002F2F3A22
MAAKTFARRVAGVWREIVGVVVSTGAANDGDIPALDATGRLHTSVMPVGYGADTKVVVASEALSAGNLVNLYDNAGTINVRKADASVEGKECNGFVLAAVVQGGNATVYFSRLITGLSGLTDGARYYLATTPGGLTATPVTGVGTVDQYIGKATSTSELTFEPDDYVVKAS